MAAPAADAQGGFRPLAMYLLIRMVIGLGLIVAAPFASRMDVHWPVLSLSVLLEVGLGSFALWLVAVLLSRRFGGRSWFLWTQVLLDAMLATLLVHLTGGPHSGLFFLYVPNIFAAGMLLRPSSALVACGVDLFAFVSSTILLSGTPVAESWDIPRPELAYELVLRSLAMLLIGMLVRMLTLQLRRVHREQSALLDEVPAGVLYLDETGRVASANTAAVRMLGDVVGQDLADVLSPREGSWEQIKRSGDELLNLLCSRSPLEIGGEIVFIEDITRLRTVEATLEAEERLAAVGRLTAALAHEIRNPLASLSGAVQLLAEERSDPLHDIVHREVKRINGLVEELLDQARPLVIQRQSMDPRPVIEEVGMSLQLDLRYRDRIDVQVDVTDCAPVSLDPGRFRQVMWNLMLNAAQAIPERGTVRLTARRDGADLLVSVSDSGVGIPAEAQQRLFDPFFTTRNGGTGLGLSTVHRIVTAHGGTIRVDSEPGQGATFIMRFPEVPATGISGGEEQRLAG